MSHPPLARTPAVASLVYGRCLAVACTIGCSLAAIAGVIEGLALYPLRSVPAVVLYLTLVGAFLSVVVGALVASVLLLVRRLR